MVIKVLSDLFSVCKVENATQIDLSKDFCFTAKMVFTVISPLTIVRYRRS